MTPEIHAFNADHISSDVVLHEEIKCRAYELCERRHLIDDHNPDRLEDELPRVVYALAELAKYEKGEVGDTRAVRAARVYLHALTSFIGSQQCYSE